MSENELGLNRKFSRGSSVRSCGPPFSLALFSPRSLSRILVPFSLSFLSRSLSCSFSPSHSLSFVHTTNASCLLRLRTYVLATYFQSGQIEMLALFHATLAFSTSYLMSGWLLPLTHYPFSFSIFTLNWRLVTSETRNPLRRKLPFVPERLAPPFSLSRLSPYSRRNSYGKIGSNSFTFCPLARQSIVLRSALSSILQKSVHTFFVHLFFLLFRPFVIRSQNRIYKLIDVAKRL